MTFDFETELPLSRTHCSKYDNLPGSFGLTSEDAIPMWVADMDFPAAPCILDTLQREIDRGYMGYFGMPGPIAESVVTWMDEKHGMPVDPKHVRFSRGVIDGIAMTLHALTDPGDGVIIFPPVYHVFFNKTRAMGRQVVEAELVEQDGTLHMDLDALESRLTGREKLVIFCSPHNPGGRLWSADEIKALTDFCAKHDLWLISDEIHMDLVFPGYKHTPTLVAAPDAADRTVVLSAASKGFNIAGAETAFAIIPDDAVRAKFDKAQAYLGGTPNRFGMVMMKSAFDHGAEWSLAVRQVLADNFALWRDRIGALPGVRVMEMQATYLSWADFTDTGLSEAEISDRIITQAQVAPSPGTQFGNTGALHRRFNLALPETKLLRAIERVETAFADLQ